MQIRSTKRPIGYCNWNWKSKREIQKTNYGKFKKLITREFVSCHFTDYRQLWQLTGYLNYITVKTRICAEFDGMAVWTTTRRFSIVRVDGYDATFKRPCGRLRCNFQVSVLTATRHLSSLCADEYEKTFKRLGGRLRYSVQVSGRTAVR